ncbi:hypothetical protein NDU88_011220 [Pleurodeles waltl]|uniref:Uncharacterized protein n=1 Tax=Pleurodeles waltl TaxID=8319 RepID=A0AAV7Q149_PLEWA|nr:hypothetical protein NDU88_011220 [Pleurodeles waltl]
MWRYICPGSRSARDSVCGVRPPSLVWNPVSSPPRFSGFPRPPGRLLFRLLSCSTRPPSRLLLRLLARPHLVLMLLISTSLLPVAEMKTASHGKGSLEGQEQ